MLHVTAAGSFGDEIWSLQKTGYLLARWATVSCRNAVTRSYLLDDYTMYYLHFWSVRVHIVSLRVCCFYRHIDLLQGWCRCSVTRLRRLCAVWWQRCLLACSSCLQSALTVQIVQQGFMWRSSVHCPMGQIVTYLKATCSNRYAHCFLMCLVPGCCVTLYQAFRGSNRIWGRPSWRPDDNRNVRTSRPEFQPAMVSVRASLENVQ